MIISAIRETTPNETRVAITPETVKKYISLGFSVHIEQNAGLSSGFTDSSYKNCGAKIFSSPQETIKNANIILKINAPTPAEITIFSANQTIIADFHNFDFSKYFSKLCASQTTCFALNLLPRISRAQNMDILSSQNNLAGYRAVIEAFMLLPKAAPLMMTAAGTVPPAKVLILGTGVAGLQAIATAKRLGAIVYASDIRETTKEQVASLGGKFVEIPTTENFESKQGYAIQASSQYTNNQKQALQKILPQIDIIIATALVPQQKAPIIIDKQMLKMLPPNSVIIDMAASSGGNIEGTQNNKLITKNNIKILGNSNLAASIPHTASNLFAQNLFNFIKSQYNTEKSTLKFDFSDELISKTCICKNGKTILEEN